MASARNKRSQWPSNHARKGERPAIAGLFFFGRTALRLRTEDFADSGLTSIDDRRLSEDRGEGFPRIVCPILGPPLVVDPRWPLVLRPQESSIRNRR